MQIVDGIALVDSRRYCSEVIEVNHKDWLSNVVYKHQAEIEQRFGVLRFENAYVNIPNGGKRTTKYALLTEDQTNAYLVFSRNTSKVRQKKLDLIAEFSKAKSFIKQTLENQFNAQPTEEEIPTCQIPGFPRSAKEVQADAGLQCIYYTKSCIKRDFIEGEDYQVDGKKLMVTEWCYRVSVGNSRSKKGRQVPASAIRLIGKADWDRLDEYQTRKETLMNARQPQNGKAIDGQLELDLNI